MSPTHNAHKQTLFYQMPFSFKEPPLFSAQQHFPNISYKV